MEHSAVLFALFGWIPVVVLLFCVFPARQAVMAAFLFAWLFLPMAGFKLAPGIPIYDKMNATCAGVLLAVVLFDYRRFTTLAFVWADLPMIVWCLCPIASSLENNLGIYDGLSSAFSQAMTWGAPYFIGRLYFRDLASLRELAIALFIGGLIYVPLCLIEIRISPQLHNMVYGFQQHSFIQSMRFGGFRPMVFMEHGLMVAMWMSCTGLIGLCLWRAGVIKTLFRVPVLALLVPLLVTAILCKSVGAVMLLVLGAAALLLATHFRSRILVWMLIAAAPLYMAVRGSGIWDATILVDSASKTINQERGDSLETRITNENMLAKKARDQALVGWGGWGRNRVYNKTGRDLSITDGFWIITFGTTGVLGLASWTGAMLIPILGLFRRYRPERWSDPAIAPAMALGMVALLYVIDCVPNGMVNPIFTLCVGAIAFPAAAPAVASAAWKNPLMTARGRPVLAVQTIR